MQLRLRLVYIIVLGACRSQWNVTASYKGINEINVHPEVPPSWRAQFVPSGGSNQFRRNLGFPNGEYQLERRQIKRSANNWASHDKFLAYPKNAAVDDQFAAGWQPFPTHFRYPPQDVGQPDLVNSATYGTSSVGGPHDSQHAVLARSRLTPSVPIVSPQVAVKAPVFPSSLMQLQRPLPHVFSSTPAYQHFPPRAGLLESDHLLIDDLRKSNEQLRTDQKLLKLQLETTQLVQDRARLSDQLEYELHAPTNVTKSKVALAMVEMLALGFCGIDRCYMGQVSLGVIKGITLGGLGVWFAIDYALVAINALQKKDLIDVLGYSALYSTDGGEIETAFWLVVIFATVHLIFTCMNLYWLSGFSDSIKTSLGIGV